MYCLEVIKSPSFQLPAKPDLWQDPCSAVFPRDEDGFLVDGGRAIARCASARSASALSVEATRRAWFFRSNVPALNAFIEVLYYSDNLTAASCAALEAVFPGWKVHREGNLAGGALVATRREGGLETRVSSGSVAGLWEKLRAEVEG